MNQGDLAFWTVDGELPPARPARDPGADESPDVILIEPRRVACALGLPVDGAAIVAWVNPLAVWGDRVAAAVARRANRWTAARARSAA